MAMAKKLTAIILTAVVCLLLCTTLTAQIHLLPAKQPEQDACGALNICGNSFSTPYSYQGTGKVADLTATPCGSGEENSMWLKLQVVTSGTIVFQIIPLDSLDDYDFAVLNTTNVSCANLSENNVVRCNTNDNEILPNGQLSNPGGIVGLNMISTITSVPDGFTGDSFCQYISAVAGQTYLVMINNFGHDANPGPSKGFTIDFTGSTAAFAQTPPPAFSSITTPLCNNATSVTIQLTNQALCSSIASDGSDFSTTPSATITGATGVNCSGSGGYTSAVTVTFASSLAAGIYTLNAQTGSDGNTLLGLCNSQLQTPANIAFKILPPIGAVDSQYICYSQLPYTWNGISVTKGGSNAATFKTTATGGCDSTVVLKLVVSPAPTTTSATKQICFGQSYNLPWNDSTVTTAGDYTHTYSNINGCDSLNSTITVTIDDPSTNASYLLCNDSSKAISPGPGFTNFVWGNGATTPTITINQPGVYMLQATDSLGCNASDTFSVSTDVITSTVSKNIPLCQGTTLQITASGGFVRYIWSNGSTQPSTTITSAGTYTLTVIDTVGCQATDTTTVVSVPVPVNFLPTAITKCFYSTLTLQPYNTYNAYLWNTKGTTPTINVLTAGTYTLQVTDANGCIGIDSTNVIDSACAEYLYLPTAFTPNGDGHNDVFKPAFAGLATNYTFIVYNRLGQKVFSSNNTADGWDGTLKGNPQPPGVYVWYCAYQLYEKQPVTQKGTVVLIR